MAAHLQITEWLEGEPAGDFATPTPRDTLRPAPEPTSPPTDLRLLPPTPHHRPRAPRPPRARGPPPAARHRLARARPPARRRAPARAAGGVVGGRSSGRFSVTLAILAAATQAGEAAALVDLGNGLDPAAGGRRGGRPRAAPLARPPDPAPGPRRCRDAGHHGVPPGRARPGGATGPPRRARLPRRPGRLAPPRPRGEVPRDRPLRLRPLPRQRRRRRGSAHHPLGGGPPPLCRHRRGAASPPLLLGIDAAVILEKARGRPPGAIERLRLAPLEALLHPVPAPAALGGRRGARSRRTTPLVAVAAS